MPKTLPDNDQNRTIDPKESDELFQRTYGNDVARGLKEAEEAANSPQSNNQDSDVGESERNGSATPTDINRFRNNFTGAGAKSSKKAIFSLQGLKRSGPLGAGVGIIGIVGILFAGSGSFLGFGIVGNLFDRFSGSVGMFQTTDDNYWRVKMFGGGTASCSKKQINCKFIGLTADEMDKLRANGAKFNPDSGKPVAGLDSFTFDSIEINGSEINAANYVDKAKDPSVKRVLQPVRKSALWMSEKNGKRVSIKRLFGISTNPDTKATDKDQLRKKVYDQVHNSTGEVNSKAGNVDDAEEAGDNDQATRNDNVEAGSTNLQEQIDAAEKAARAGTLVAKDLPTGNLVTAIGQEGTSIEDARNPFNKGWSWINSLDGADLVCTAYQLINTAATLAKTVAVINIMRYGHLYLAAIQKQQAGESSQEEIEELMKIITTPNKYGEAFDTSAAMQYLFTGQLSTSTPLSISAVGGETLQYMTQVMYGIHKTVGFGSGTAGRALLSSGCGVVTNLAFQIVATVVDWGVTIVASVFTGGGALAGRAAVKAVTTTGLKEVKGKIIKEFKNNFVTQLLSRSTSKEVKQQARKDARKFLRQQALDPINLIFIGMTLVETFGMDYIVQTLAGTDVLAMMDDSVQTGEAIVTARAGEDYMSSIGMGASVLSFEEAAQYKQQNQQAIAISKQEERLGTDPLDITNPNSSLGSFLAKMATITAGSNASSGLYGLKNLAGMPLKAFSNLALMPSVGAADTGPTCQELSEFIADPYMMENEICNNVVGFPEVGADLEYIKSHPMDELLESAIKNNYIKPNGNIVADSAYAKHVDECNNETRTQIDDTMFEGDLLQPAKCRELTEQRKYFNTLTLFRSYLSEDTGQQQLETTIVSPVAPGFDIRNGFGPRVAPCQGCSSWHVGQDVGAPASDKSVYVIMDGDVISGPSGVNNVIRVKHADGLVSSYWHMYASDILVKAGDTVTAGQKIGKEGCAGQCTGPHLHFELDVTELDDPAEYEKYTHNTAGTYSPAGTRIDPAEYFKLNGVEGW